MIDAATSPRSGVTRRAFLAGATALANPCFALAGTSRGVRDTLIVVFLRGGADALSLVPPYADSGYAIARPTIAVPPPGPNGALDLDGFFGLHPTLAPLLPLYTSQRLAIIHTVGVLNPERSHFVAARALEEGRDGIAVTGGSGWFARHLRAVVPAGSGALRAIAEGSALPLTLVDAPAALPVPTGVAYDLRGDVTTRARRRQRIALMASGIGGPLGEAMHDTLSAIAALAATNSSGPPANGASYPASDFGAALRHAAAIVQADIGVEYVHIELGGWDDHAGLLPLAGRFRRRVEELGLGLAALATDLGADLDRTTVLVMSEFGRRVDENAGRGVDHGRAGCVFVLGGAHVDGGRVLHAWPGLASGVLDGGAVPVRFDIRDVLAETLEARLGGTNLADVFPTLVHTPLGLFR